MLKNAQILSARRMKKEKKMNKIKIIGAGLAGCEAAYQLAKRGIAVTLYEMNPKK